MRNLKVKIRLCKLSNDFRVQVHKNKSSATLSQNKDILSDNKNKFNINRVRFAEDLKPVKNSKFMSLYSQLKLQ